MLLHLFFDLAGAEGLEVASQPPPKHSRPARLQRFALLLVLSYHRLAASSTGRASAVLPGTLRVPRQVFLPRKKTGITDVIPVFLCNENHAIVAWFKRG